MLIGIFAIVAFAYENIDLFPIIAGQNKFVWNLRVSRLILFASVSVSALVNRTSLIIAQYCA